MGMASMRERAEAVGGRPRIESAPGRGTRVIVEVPHAAAPHATPAPA
jgi:two-component system sensor histidine kinase DesK